MALGTGLPVAKPGPNLPLLALSAAAVGYSIVYLTTNCGGADSYGYVSAALLIRHGTLSVPQPDLSWLPASNALSVLTPLGYAPRPLDGTIVPHYPLGFPALIAIASLVLPTSIAPYLVTPICDVAALLLTYLITSRVTAQRATAWLAVALVAWDPLVMTYAKQPMSDLPAAVFFLLALWCLLRERPAPFAAGLAAGAAFVIRPGGLGAIAALGLLAILPNPRAATAEPPRRFGEQMRAGVLFALGVMPRSRSRRSCNGTCSAVRSGPDMARSRSLRRPVAGRQRAHLRPGVAADARPGLAAPGAVRVHRETDPAICACGAWSSSRRASLRTAVLPLRSLGDTPVHPSSGHRPRHRGGSRRAALLERVTPVVRVAGTIALAAFVAIHAGTFLQRQGVPLLMDQERRYTLTADWIDQYTPATALVIAGQHSGSVRHYAGRTTLRWDLLDPKDLEPVVRGARERGRAVFAVLEGNEQAAFRDRFAPVLAGGADGMGVRLLPGAQVRNVQIWEVIPPAGETR